MQLSLLVKSGNPGNDCMIVIRLDELDEFTWFGVEVQSAWDDGGRGVHLGGEPLSVPLGGGARALVARRQRPRAGARVRRRPQRDALRLRPQGRTLEHDTNRDYDQFILLSSVVNHHYRLIR